MKCTFTTNITDELDCDPNGNFDHYGFPLNRCVMYPCQQYKEMVEAINFRVAAQDILEPKTHHTTWHIRFVRKLTSAFSTLKRRICQDVDVQ